MTEVDDSRMADPRGGPGPREFIALLAALMASNALAIDTMLAALPAIGDNLDVANPNARQLVLTAYLVGFGAAQLIWGPLSDRFGRKWLLVVSLVLYTLFAAVAGLAASFTLLLAARFLQGVAAAATRVLVTAVVRDRFQGAAMARTMSLVMIIFILVPVVAPTFGQGVLALSSWRHIFIILAIYGLVLALWTGLRLPETLTPAARRELSFRNLIAAGAETLGNRRSIGNTAIVTLAFGGLFAFITSVQQIVFDVFGRPELIGLVFACVAAPMAISSYANSRLVHDFGPRRMLQAALIAFCTFSLLHLAVTEWAGETIWSFTILLAVTMLGFGLIGANANALAMEPLGHIAGMASSLQGAITTVGGALIGYGVGQQLDGTTLPFLIGFAACSVTALLIFYWANPV